MSLKIKALLQLIALVMCSIASILLVDSVVTYVPREILVDAVGFGLLGGLFYSGYSLLLARLESQETLDKIQQDLKK
jgi:hypothetical protein